MSLPDRLPEKWRLVSIVAALALGWAVLYMDRSILFPLLPVIADDFRLTGVQRGAIASVYFVTYVLMQVPSGVLGDRFGLKNVVTAMYLIIGLGLLGIGVFSLSYGLLLVFIAVQGFGAGAFYPGSYGITISTVPPHRRGISSAVVTAGMATGSALGLTFSGTLYELAGTWRGPYLFLLGPTLLMALALWALIGRVPRAPKGQGGFRYLLGNRDLLALSVANFFSLYAYFVVFTWGPSLLVEERGVSVSRAGLYTALVAVCSFAGALTWGRLSDRFGRKPLTLLMFAMAGAMASLVTSVQSTPLLLVILGVYGFFGTLAWNPVLVAWVGDHTFASGRVGMGTVMGVMNAIGIASAFVAPVVSGWTRDMGGSLAWAFYLAALAYLVAMLGALGTREALGKPAPRVSPAGQREA